MIMKKVKNWCYGGHDKEFFRSGSERIRDHNLKYSGTVMAVMCLVTLIFFVFDQELGVAPMLRQSYMACAIGSGIIFALHLVYLKKVINKAGLYFCVFAEMVFAFLLYVEVVQTPDSASVFLAAFFLAMPLVPLIPWHMTTLVLAVDLAAFVWATFRFKDPALIKADIVSAAICMVFGVTFGYGIFRERVGELAAYFQLKERSQSELSVALNSANTDPMTHVRSRVAYENAEHLLDIQIFSDEKPTFGLVVCDINWLKQTNDTFGHEFGDKLIKACCKIVCNVFNHSPVYRIGGDEFAVILQGDDYNRRRILMELMAKELHYDQTGVSLACGMAVYSPDEDKCFDDVFRRADGVMYESKKRIKSSRSFSESIIEDLK